MASDFQAHAADALHGLIFDVDGVVADTEGVNAAASIRVFEDLFGLSGVRPADFEAGLGRGAAEYMRAAARVHGVELSDADVERATAARLEGFLARLAASPLPAFPGVLELMRVGLERDDFRVAIATSSAREKSQAVLESAGVPWRDLVYITGDDVTRKKPDPEIFLTAADRIGVPPARCLVIEDAPNGVAAARAADCRCVAVTNTVSRDKLADADRVVDSLAEITIDDIAVMIDSAGDAVR